MTGLGGHHASRACRVLVLLLAFAPVCRLARAVDPDERGLWQLWQQHVGKPADHQGLLTACRSFADRRSGDPLVVVSSTLAAWHLLQLGQRDEATAAFQRILLLEGDSLRNGAKLLSRSWLSRIDREKVKEALRFYYLRNVAYPRKLSELVDYPKLPQSLAFNNFDRWNSTWRYRLCGLKTIPGLMDQKYLLECRRLGSGSDLTEAMLVPCGVLPRVESLFVKRTTPGRMAVLEMKLLTEGVNEETQTTGKRSALMVGTSRGPLYLAYVGQRIVIVSDYYHWRVLPNTARDRRSVTP
jgi:hypothetical protein